jgi:hypothetical protein
MPGEKEPATRVADECAKLLLLISQLAHRPLGS